MTNSWAPSTSAYARYGTGPLYHLIILRWVPLLSLSVAVYVAIVGLFALLFAACGRSVSLVRACAVFISVTLIELLFWGEARTPKTRGTIST